MTQRGKLILSWVLVALWAALIFFMSAHAGSDFSGTGPLAAVKGWLVSLAAPAFGEDTDIVNVAAHLCEYLVFGMLLFRAARLTVPGRPHWWVALTAVALASAYGITDELHQAFVPGRLCDPADWLTDTLGASLGATLAAILVRGDGRREKRDGRGPSQ